MTSDGPDYEVLIEPAARRVLAKLPRNILTRLMAHIEAWGANPRPHGTIKLSGHEEYRLGVGDFRIIYSILDDRLLVVVVKVGNRREVYRGS